jgi:hypothetical protein
MRQPNIFYVPILACTANNVYLVSRSKRKQVLGGVLPRTADCNYVQW